MTDLQDRPVPWPPPHPEHRRVDPEPTQKDSLGRLFILIALALALGALYSWWALVLVLGFLLMLFVHELGHYMAARRTGMKVTEFFLGFGPRIWSFRRGETEYGLKVIPLGAYVRIIGMNNLEDVDPADESRTFRSKGYFSRVLVAAAGVMMNFALAIVLLFVAMVGFGTPKESRWVVSSVSANSPAAAAQLRPGDQIVAVDGVPTGTWAATTQAIRTRPGQTVTLTILRGGETITAQAALASRNPSSNEQVGFLGIGPTYPTQRLGALEGAQQSFSEFGRITYQSVAGLGKIFSPDGLRNYSRLISGDPEANQTNRLLSPVGAVKIGTEVARTGFGDLLFLLAAVNIFVGLMNLIPLLPFDGGHIAIATYEAVRSRKGKPYRADVRKLLPVSYAVLAVVAVLFIGNFYLDLKL